MFQAEDKARAKALRWEGTQRMQGTQREPVWLQRLSGTCSRRSWGGGRGPDPAGPSRVLEGFCL